MRRMAKRLEVVGDELREHRRGAGRLAGAIYKRMLGRRSRNSFFAATKLVFQFDSDPGFLARDDFDFDFIVVDGWPEILAVYGENRQPVTFGLELTIAQPKLAK